MDGRPVLLIPARTADLGPDALPTGYQRLPTIVHDAAGPESGQHACPLKLAVAGPGDPWEDAVTAVLTALCRPGGARIAEAAIRHCLAFEPEEGLAVFTTRLALSALDAAGPEAPAARNLIEQLSNRTGEGRPRLHR
ncbi:hypothetical protein [Kitasatospora sp. HPMI-4]|uniref:hypothetical protein n=1 Tax=Kitasatospora sp. HPMI-4 TaxID=3448443 RepID=UPI003F1D1F39